jgi:hypothetical protein
MDFETVDELEKKYRSIGPKITKLIWNGRREKIFGIDKLDDVFSLMPNLKHLNLRFWNGNAIIGGREMKEIVNLKKLKTLELSHFDAMAFKVLSQALPANLLNHFIVDNNYPEEDFIKFFTKQKLIRNVELNGNFTNVKVFEELKLEKFTNDFIDDDFPLEQRKFLNALVKQQPQLLEMNLLSSDYVYKFIDDEVFGEICKLQKLKSLRFNIDGITETGIKQISQSTNLKTLEVMTNNIRSLETFKGLSEVELPALKSLVLRLWDFNLPQEIYQNFAKNCINLKSLKITLGNQQTLNFFMTTFPSLESLEIRFGESNKKISFDQAYNDDGQQNVNLKELSIMFTDEENIHTEKFMIMLKAFPNLEKMEIISQFPFTSKFLTKLYENIGSIKDLTLQKFQIGCDEKFPNEIVQIVKKIFDKLERFEINFRNSVKHTTLGNLCLMKTSGKLELEIFNKFSYRPIIDALKDEFVIESDGYSNIQTVNWLKIEKAKS